MCYTVPEIWCVIDVIIFHFGLFVALLPLLTAQKIKMKKKKRKKKWKKHLEISSFYASVPKIMIMCYTVLEIRCITDKIVLFHFGLFFALFTPLTTQKIKILKKWKKLLEISSFYICVPKIMIRWCTVPGIWCATDGRTEKVTYRGGCLT